MADAKRFGMVYLIKIEHIFVYIIDLAGTVGRGRALILFEAQLVHAIYAVRYRAKSKLLLVNTKTLYNTHIT